MLDEEVRCLADHAIVIAAIGRYDAAGATTLVDRIEAIIAETGQTGFHLIDEAAPPKSLKALAAELQRRRLSISRWGNIRFEKTFTPKLCQQADYGFSLLPLPLPLPPGRVARNDVGFVDPTGVDHDALAAGLKKAIYNYMHGVGLDEDVRMWWDHPVPKTRVSRRQIQKALLQAD